MVEPVQAAEPAHEGAPPPAGGAGAEPDAPPQRSRSVRHIKAAARMLQREARGILKRHAARIPPDAAEAMRACVAAIDTFRERLDWARVEHEAELLDELLHQHATFARKSPARETFENVALAVLAALGLRTCLYEPFKIPSGSMMPTLRTDDHIFVNKFALGVQVPFTNTIIGQDWLREIQRGDVLVFRYPLDPSIDYIKRVIGLPGDTIQLDDDRRLVRVKPAGATEWLEATREPLDERCLAEPPADDEDAAAREADPNLQYREQCQVFRETLGGRSYTVRYYEQVPTYLRGGRLSARRPPFVVPEGHYFVMGDNRDDSADSRAWVVEGEGVDATKLVTVKDLDDVLGPGLRWGEARSEPSDLSVALGDPNYDRAVRPARSHRDPRFDLGLRVWRAPEAGLGPIERTLVDHSEGATVATIAGMLARAQPPLEPGLAARIGGGGQGIDRLWVGRAADGARVAIAALEPQQAVILLRCGVGLCPDEPQLARQLVSVVTALERDPLQSASELLAAPVAAKAGVAGVPRDLEWSPGLGDPAWGPAGSFGEAQVDRRYTLAAAGAGGEGGSGGASADEGARVRLRAWLAPPVAAELLRDWAARQAGIEPSDAERATELDPDAFVLRTPRATELVWTQPKTDVVVAVRCGVRVCPTVADAIALAKQVKRRTPAVANGRAGLAGLLTRSDVEGLDPVRASGGRVTVQPEGVASGSAIDVADLDANRGGDPQAIEVELWRRPPKGIDARVASLRLEAPELAANDAVVPGGLQATGPGGTVHVLPIPAADAVVRLRCADSVCADPAVATALARRAAEKAADPAIYVDPKARRPQPFVPRGYVKGLAVRIWLPLRRLWTAIE
jgi:signal peptidase I